MEIICCVCDKGDDLMHKAVDLRIQRTEIMIQEALISLISEKGFDAITIGDIAERAMVNRATFYRHYEDKYALVSAIFEKAMQKLLSELGPLEQRLEIVYLVINEHNALDDQAPNPEMEHALASYTAFIEHIGKNAKLYKTLLGRQGSSWFSAQLRDYLSQNMHARLQESKALISEKMDFTDPIYDKALTVGLASWFIGVVTCWLEDGMQLPSRKIAIFSLRFMIYGMYPYIQSLNTALMSKSGIIE
jgi:AcrR family transcriptional regulator